MLLQGRCSHLYIREQALRLTTTENLSPIRSIAMPAAKSAGFVISSTETWTADTSRCVPRREPGNEDPSGIRLRLFVISTSFLRVNSTASYRVYVITSTGNEKGSNTVIITRPIIVPPPWPLPVP